MGKVDWKKKDDLFRRLFPYTSTKRVAMAFGISVMAVNKRAMKLGLRKDESYLHDMHISVGKSTGFQQGNTYSKGINIGNQYWRLRKTRNTGSHAECQLASVIK